MIQNRTKKCPTESSPKSRSPRTPATLAVCHRPPGPDDAATVELLAQARAAGCTIKDAAAQAGMGERTARRRLGEPDLVARVDALHAERRAEDLARLEGLRPKAVARLDELLDSKSPNVQLGAIRAVLSLGSQLREHAETEARVRALEELAAPIRADASRPDAAPRDWPS